MKIGILSDSHDHPDAMKAAIDVLRQFGAEFYIHCGDIGGQRCIDLLAGLPSAFVWGNTDWDRVSLAAYAKSVGVDCHGAMASLELGGKKLAVLHGDDPNLKKKLLSDQNYDYLLQGHTHLRQDEKVGKTRIINPGALHRTREKSVAILDTETDGLRFLVVG
jgi:hypothetical protein